MSFPAWSLRAPEYQNVAPQRGEERHFRHGDMGQLQAYDCPEPEKLVTNPRDQFSSPLGQCFFRHGPWGLAIVPGPGP